MKKRFVFIPLLTLSAAAPLFLLKDKEVKPVNALSGPTNGSLKSKQDIKLNDNSESEIRSYYSKLNNLSEAERKGDNILKNLKPILQQFTYYSYDAVWKIYEITDREWSLSPASETTFGSYNSSTNIITNYEYGSNSNGKNNPYVHTLYRNRDENGVTVESGRIKEWGDHSQQGGTNREHVWCQSRGFKADSGANGPAGTDLHHLISGDGYVNGKPHNNNPYGYVDRNNIEMDASASYAYCSGNYSGAPRNKHSEDQSTVVFEPQDSDKGDIARACFYMVACYNNLSGADTITQFNPNLTLVDYATSNGAREDSTAEHAVGMGILSDLLEWHRLDPVDEYEIHRNNLIFNNYQFNRNPFIDFPEWVEYIWGNKKGTTAINPATDEIGKASETPVGPGDTSEETSATSEATSVTSQVTSDTSGTTPGGSSDEKKIPILYIVIGGAALVVLILLLILIPSLRKKAKRKAKSAVEKQVKSQTKSSSNKKKK